MQNKNTSEFTLILRHKSKLKSQLSELNSKELKVILHKFSNIVEEILTEKEKEEKAKQKTLKEAKSLLKSTVLSKSDLESLFTELTGINPKSLAKSDKTARRRKSELPVKYRAEFTNEKGKIITHTWTGTGRRPDFFAGLSEQELSKYRTDES